MTELEVNGKRYEVAVEAEGGITLSEGVRWWGSRVKYRRFGIADRRWTRFLLVDVHPFDDEAIEAAVKAHIGMIIRQAGREAKP